MPSSPTKSLDNAYIPPKDLYLFPPNNHPVYLPANKNMNTEIFSTSSSSNASVVEMPVNENITPKEMTDNLSPPSEVQSVQSLPAIDNYDSVNPNFIHDHHEHSHGKYLIIYEQKFDSNTFEIRTRFTLSH